MESNSKSTGHKKRRDEESNKSKEKKEGVVFVDSNEEESDGDIISIEIPWEVITLEKCSRIITDSILKNSQRLLRQIRRDFTIS